MLHIGNDDQQVAIDSLISSSF